MSGYWTCFAYKDYEPHHLHCTHKYLGVQPYLHIWDIIEITAHYFENFIFEVPVVNFNKIEWFEPGIRVLLPSEPVILLPVLRTMLDEYRDDDFPYNPHVTCYTEDGINKPFTKYCLVKNDEIIAQWGL